MEPSSLSLRRVRELFDAIDAKGGIAGRWWLERQLSFAGNGNALDRWLDDLIKEGYLEEVEAEQNGPPLDGPQEMDTPKKRKYYRKTKPLGELFHAAVKDHKHVKIMNSVIRHYSKDRLTR